MALPPKIQKILTEAGLAVAFHDRVLFYSIGTNTNAKQALPKIEPLWSFAKFEDNLLGLDSALNDPITGVSFTDAKCNELALQINRLYSDAIDMLHDRGNYTFTEYFRLRRDVEKTSVGLKKIKIVDRPIAHALQCQIGALQIYRDCILAIFVALGKAIAFALPYNSPSRKWKAFRECGFVYMEEMTFLSKRIDDFNNMVIAARGLQYALCGIVASVFFSASSLAFVIHDEWWGKNSSEKTSASILTELQTLPSKLPNIPSQIKVVIQRPDDSDEALNSLLEIKDLRTQIDNLRVEIEKKQPPPIIINIPKQAISKKTIGIINIDTSHATSAH